MGNAKNYLVSRISFSRMDPKRPNLSKNDGGNHQMLTDRFGGPGLGQETKCTEFIFKSKNILITSVCNTSPTQKLIILYK